jgi:hypothetical protein
METVNLPDISPSKYSEARNVASSFVQFPNDFHTGIIRRYISELSSFLTRSHDVSEADNSKDKDWSIPLNAYTVRKLAEISTF